MESLPVAPRIPATLLILAANMSSAHSIWTLNHGMLGDLTPANRSHLSRGERRGWTERGERERGKVQMLTPSCAIYTVQYCVVYIAHRGHYCHVCMVLFVRVSKSYIIYYALWKYVRMCVLIFVVFVWFGIDFRHSFVKLNVNSMPMKPFQFNWGEKERERKGERGGKREWPINREFHKGTKGQSSVKGEKACLIPVCFTASLRSCCHKAMKTLRVPPRGHDQSVTWSTSHDRRSSLHPRTNSTAPLWIHKQLLSWSRACLWKNPEPRSPQSNAYPLFIIITKEPKGRGTLQSDCSKGDMPTYYKSPNWISQPPVPGLKWTRTTTKKEDTMLTN